MKLTTKSTLHLLAAPILCITLTSMSMDPDPVLRVRQYKVKKDDFIIQRVAYGDSELREATKKTFNIAVHSNEVFISVLIKHRCSDASYGKSVTFSPLLLPISLLLNKKNEGIITTMPHPLDNSMMVELIYHSTPKNQFSQDIQNKMQQFKLAPDIFSVKPHMQLVSENDIDFFFDEGIVMYDDQNGEVCHGPKGYPNRMFLKPYGDSVHQFVMQRQYGKPHRKPRTTPLSNLIGETTEAETKTIQ